MGFLREAFRSGNRFILRVAIIAAIGGFLFGYDTGVIGGALLYIKKDLGLSTFGQEAVVASLLLGAAAGAVMSGWSSDVIGRRWTKVISGCIYVIGALGSAFAPTQWWLIVARFVLGFSVGTASFVAPQYISEQAPKSIRGGVTTFNQLMVTSGILIAYIINFALGSDWRLMLGLAAIPGAALAIGMVLMPSSPRWLIEQGREDEAREILARSRPEGEVDEEIEGVREAAEREGGVGDLVKPEIRPILAVGLALAIFQQFIGVNTIIYYAPTILSYTGLSAHSAILQTVVVGVTNVVFTIVAVLLLDKVGRRKLLLTGTSICVVALGVLGVFFVSGAVQDAVPWLALVCLLVYIAGFAFGLGPVFWLMISEIFPLRVRSPAMATSTVANWLSNFLISVTFLSVIAVISRAGAFWIYGALGIIALAIFAKRVPETKDRSLEDIERELRGGEIRGSEDGDAVNGHRPRAEQPERSSR